MIRKVGRAVQLSSLALVILAYSLLAHTPIAKAAGKVSLSPESSTMTEGQTQDVTVALTEPIISADPPGFVQVYISSNTQSRLVLNESFVEFAENEWSVHKTFNITAHDDALLNGDQTVTLSFNIYSNSEYYNEYSGSTTITVQDNESAPEASITTPTAGQNIPAGSLMVTGTATPGFQVAVIIDGKNEGTTTSDSSGNWSVLVPKVSGGSHDIKAQVQTSAHYAYLANAYTGSIDVVNIETHSYVYEIAGAESVGATFNSQKNIVYSASNAEDGCQIIGYDPNTYEEVANITPEVACTAISMALSPDGKTGWLLYEDGAGGGNYAVMEANLQSETSVSQVPLSALNGSYPSGIDINPNGSEFWVRTTDGLQIFNSADHSYKASMTLGDPGTAYRQNIVFNKSGTRAYTANSTSGVVSEIDATTKAVVDEVTTGQGANMVALTPDESQLFVGASYPSSSIYVIDSTSFDVVDTFVTDFGLPPESLAITDDGQWVVGDDHGSGAIFFGKVSSGATVANTIYGPAGGSYYTSTSGFTSPSLVNVLGVSTTTPFSATAYAVPNTGFDLSK